MKLADPEKAIDKHININDKNVVFACFENDVLDFYYNIS